MDVEGRTKAKQRGVMKLQIVALGEFSYSLLVSLPKVFFNGLFFFIFCRSVAAVVLVMVLASVEAAPNKTFCEKMCPNRFRPVCARNSEGKFKNFINQCLMRKHNCIERDSKYRN